MKYMIKKLTFIPAVSLIALSLAFSASAAAVKTGEKYDLGAGESVKENLYVGSGNINISGDVLGDLMAGGGNIMITGRNSRDVLLAGGSISVLGPVSDDLRLLGGDIIVGKNVGGDLLAVGGSIQLLSGAIVNGEMMAAGGMITVDGTVAGDFTAIGGELAINGKVYGNVRIKNVEKLTIGSGAVIGGNLEYASANDAVVAAGSKIGGEIVRSPAPDWARTESGRKWMRAGDGGLFDALGLTFDIMKLAAYLAAALLLVRYFGGYAQASAERIRANFWPEALRGFLVIAVIPVLMLAMAITIIGFLPAVLAGLLFAGLWILAKLISSIFLGAWLFGRFSMDKLFAVNWKSAVLGTFCFLILKEIPIFGWIPAGLLMLAALGELSNQVYGKAREMLSR